MCPSVAGVDGEKGGGGGWWWCGGGGEGGGGGCGRGDGGRADGWMDVVHTHPSQSQRQGLSRQSPLLPGRVCV